MTYFWTWEVCTPCGVLESNDSTKKKALDLDGAMFSHLVFFRFKHYSFIKKPNSGTLRPFLHYQPSGTIKPTSSNFGFFCSTHITQIKEIHLRFGQPVRHETSSNCKYWEQWFDFPGCFTILASEAICFELWYP
jgi:hypothetical protein